MEYEASIYDALFIIPVVLLVIGLGLFVYAFKQKEHQWLWWVGLAFIVSSSLIVLLMPSIKGYWCINRHDMMEHIGLTIDMASLTAVRNTYPIVHIIPTGLVWLGIKPNLAVNLMPATMYLLYLSFAYLLGRSIFSNPKSTILLLACTSLLLLPNDGFYSSSMVFAIITIGVLAVCLYVSRHQHSKFMLIGIPVLAISIGSVIWLFSTRPQLLGTSEVAGNTPLIIPAYDTETNSFFEKARGYIKLAELNGLDIIWLLLKLYGGEIIFGILAIASLIYMKVRNWRYIVIAVAFAAVNLIFWTYFFGWLPVQWAVPHGYTDELLKFVPCFSIILAVPLLGHLFKRKAKGYIMVGILLCTAGVFSIFNAFPSPLIYQPNNMVSQLEIEGARWLIDNKEDNVPVAHLGLPVRRYGTALYGVSWWKANGERLIGFVDLYPAHPVKVPNHLGYNHNPATIGDVFDEPTYLIITGYDKKLYTEVWKPPIPTRWSGEDFVKLHSDANAELQYSNEDFEVWLINGGKQ